MTLMRGWIPNGNLLNPQDEMHRLLHDLVRNGESGKALPGWLPAVDVQESKTNYTLRIDLPGVNPKDVKLEMVEGRLSVRGERKPEPGVDGTVTHLTERATGTFERAFRLKAKVDSDGIKATYRDGVLLINVPKAPEAVKREIAIDLG